MTDVESAYRCLTCGGRMWEVVGDIFLKEDEIHITSLTHFCPKCRVSWYFNQDKQQWEKLQGVDEDNSLLR